MNEYGNIKSLERLECVKVSVREDTNRGGNENYNKGISIYPNPSNGLFQIYYPVSVNIISVCQFDGKEIKSFNLTDLGFKEIDLSELSSGVYLLRFNLNETIIENKKITIIR